MAKVKKVKVLSYAKVQGIIMGFAGVVAGILYAGIGTIYDAYIGEISYGTALAYMAIPLMPIYFAVFGFITGVIGAVTYNMVSKWFGGIEMNIEKKD